MCKVLIVDDHAMVREGIRYILESYSLKRFFEVDEASNGAESVEKTQTVQYDIILMDYQMPVMSGKEAISAIIANNPDAKILVISNYDEYDCVQSVIKAGARGYVLKNIEPQDLILAIDAVVAGKYYYSNDIAVKLIHFPAEEPSHEDESECETLTKREIGIIHMIYMEKTNEEIAHDLLLSKSTVDSHRQRILRKLKVKNTVGLIKIAIERGLIKNAS
jgi:DNA-binding NarL/FixJ family response regulator